LGIAVARLSQNLLLRLAAPFGGWLVAILLHSLFNALLSMQNGAIALLALCVSWTTWLLVLALVLVAISRDRARIREYLKDEVAAGILSPAQYRVASSAFSASITRLGAFGSGHYWDTRRFYQVCAELAQKKEQLQRFGNERGNTAEVEKLRAELGRLAPVAHA
jgi:hypothetical protein